jgi:site-specific DNA-cytosine methylase
MNVLSLFDGMSCGQIALERAGFKTDRYVASEIKKSAIELVKKRYPNTIHVGSVTDIMYDRGVLKSAFPGYSPHGFKNVAADFDLLIGGSPCKGGSGLNQRRDGMKHRESNLFYEYVRILGELREYNPKVYFLLENVPGNKKFVSEITKVLGVKPIRFNSRLVSAQNRMRYYWTNIPVNSMPKPVRITTEDVFSKEMPPELIATDGRVKWIEGESGKKSIRSGYTRVNPYPKSGCITANGHKKWNENYIFRDGKYRYLSVSELEKLQTLPDGYCDGLSYDDAYDLIGDGWTVDIVAHIFSHLPGKLKKPNPYYICVYA